MAVFSLGRQAVSSVQTIIAFLSSVAILISPALSAQTKKTVAITAIVAHPSLQLARTGILAGLKEGGFAATDLNLIEEDAHGNVATAALIAKKFVSQNPDVIIPISTPSAQAVLKAAQGSTIPIVFSSVTDPVAAGLVLSLKGSSQVTGAIDLPSLETELVLIKAFLPNLKKLGVLYNPGEANSVKALAQLRVLVGTTFEIVEATIPSTALVSEVAKSLIGKVDAVFFPLDNTVVSALPIVVKVTQAHKLPLFSCDPENVKQGVTAAFGFSQYAVGHTAGLLAARILKGEAVASLPIATPTTPEVFVNSQALKLLGLATPHVAGYTVNPL